MSEPTQAQTVKPAAPANRNVVLIALVAVNMIGLFGLGGYLVYSTSAGAQAAPAAGEEGEDGDVEAEGDEGEDEGDEGEDEGDGEHAARDQDAPHEMGPLVEFESMVVNLHEDTSDHYLKITFQVELTNEEVAAEAEGRMVPFRDATLMYLSSLTVAQASGPENALAVRTRLLDIARRTLGRRTVRHVYFTEYLVQ